jgi:hypothetical protein
LEIGRHGERYMPSLMFHPAGTAIIVAHPLEPVGQIVPARRFAGTVAALTRNADLWGSNPGFDMRHLGELMATQGTEPGWHHHPNDIPSAAAGWCAAKGITAVSARGDGKIRSDDWSRAVGVDPDAFERHTALGDCRWTLAQFAAMGLGEVET